MEESSKAPHVLIVSHPTQGNINPLLRLARRLAAKGLLVTFSCTHASVPKVMDSTNAGLELNGEVICVGKGHLRFEFFSDGWDLDDPRRADHGAHQMKLSTYGPKSLTELVNRQVESGSAVTCIITSSSFPWAGEVANNLNIPWTVLWTQSSSVFSIYYHYFHTLADFSGSTVTIPGLPTLRRNDIPSYITDETKLFMTNTFKFQFANIHKAKWVLVNSFRDLEIDAINGLSEHSTIIPVGPLVDVDVTSGTGECIEWLNTQELRSVVYVSLGSIAVVSKEVMLEMAKGLMNCKRQFLWVVREECEHLLPEDFVKGILGRGIVVRWSPQEQVLNHRAVGCFVTHCGWNSTMEAIASGVPVVTYPLWGDQLTDSMFLVEVYKVGVRLKSPVEGGELVKCINQVIENEDMKERSSVLKEAARSAVKEGGSSDQNIQAFVDEINKSL